MRIEGADSDTCQYKVDFGSIEWQSPLPGVRFRAFVEGSRRMRLVEYTSDFVEPDWCAKGHIGYVIEGRFEIDFDGQVVQLAPGDGIFIPPGVEHKHKARVLSDIARVFLVDDT